MSTYLKIFLIAVSVFIFILDFVAFINKKSGKSECTRTGLKVFAAEGMFFIGEFLLRHADVSQSVKNRRKRLLSEIYDQVMVSEICKNAEYAAPTYMGLFVPCILLIGAITENLTAIFLLLGLVVFMCFYFDIWLKTCIEERHEEIRYDYATILTKISLLVNAGLTASDAFERVAYSNDTLLYREMQRTVCDISNGMSIEVALNNLSVRGGCREVKKFVSLYKQNLVRGGTEFPFLLSEMADAAWLEKKNRARQIGGLASQKLLLPIMLMFSGILIMVIVPAFNSLL